MTAGSWLNNDGLYIQYGTQKAVPEVAGDYLSYGTTRVVEFTMTLATLTTTPLIISNTTFFPSTVFIEDVQVDTELGAAGGTSFSVGSMGLDRSTVTGTYANTTFLSAVPIADHTTAGQRKDYTAGITGAGTAIGATTAFSQGGAYITALAAGTYTGTGTVKVRIFYRGIGTITQ